MQTRSPMRIRANPLASKNVIGPSNDVDELDLEVDKLRDCLIEGDASPVGLWWRKYILKTAHSMEIAEGMDGFLKQIGLKLLVLN